MAGQRRSTAPAPHDIDLDSRAFEEGLKRAMRDFEIKTERDLLRLAIDVQNRAKELCPVDTGRLRASIDHEPGRDRRGPYVDVGVFGVFYSPFVEYGTFNMRSQPFIRPALAEAVGFFAQGIGTD